MRSDPEWAPLSGYRCVLDDQPDLWVPRALRSTHSQSAARVWSANPHLRFSRAGRCPDNIPFANAVAAAEPMVWVTDPVTSVVAPFVVGPRLDPSVSSLRNGVPPQDLEPAVTSILMQAGLIYDAAEIESTRERWQESCRRARAQFESGYARLGQLLHPFTLGAIRTYFRRYLRNGRPRFGDQQVARRWVAHNEPVACFLHHQLLDIVSAISNVSLKPSYAYFASYEEGARLAWHKDREQCEISLSMLIDYEPEPDSESPWPLLLNTGESVIPIHQQLGETLIYRGREIAHARDELQLGHRSTHLFFHYVARDFQGDLR